MRHRSIWLLSVVGPFATWASIQGCGGESINAIDGGVDGTTAMDSGGMDTSLDAPANDSASGDAGDTGVLDSGVDTGTAAFFCDDAGVSDCSQCNGRPRPCVNCFIDGGATASYCVSLQTSCFPPGNSPLQRCPCTTEANCKAPFQTCGDVGLGPACRTCGETNTINDGCKGGGMCRPDGGCN